MSHFHFCFLMIRMICYYQTKDNREIDVSTEVDSYDYVHIFVLTILQNVQLNRFDTRML